MALIERRYNSDSEIKTLPTIAGGILVTQLPKRNFRNETACRMSAFSCRTLLATRPPLRQPRLKKGSAQDVVRNREVNHDAGDIDERRHERRRRRRRIKSEAAQQEREHGAEHAPPEHHADQTQRYRRSHQRVMSCVEWFLARP